MPFETVFDNYSEFEELIRCIKNNITPVNVITGVGAQRAHLLFGVQKKLNRPIFVMTATDVEAQVLTEDLRFFFAPEQVLLFPSKEYVYYDIDSVSREMSLRRLAVLAQLADGTQGKIVVAGIDAALQYSADKKAFTENILHFTVGRHGRY